MYHNRNADMIQACSESNGCIEMEKTLDVRIQRSQAALINAGRELLRKNSEATLSDIASHAGVGRTTLYRLFETKEELVKAIAKDCLEVFDRATEHLEREAESAMDGFRLTFHAIIPLDAELEFLMKLGDIGENDPELLAIYEKQQAEMAELIELAKQEGSIAKRIPTRWIVNHLEGLLYTAWLSARENLMSNESLAELTFNTFCHGLQQD